MSLCLIPLADHFPKPLQLGEGGGQVTYTHFYCVLHAKIGGGVQIASTNVYVINAPLAGMAG